MAAEIPATHVIPAPTLNAETLCDRPAADRPTSVVSAVEQLLVDTDAAAAAVSISPASWFRLKAAGKTPAPVKLGGRTLYRVEDLRLWVSWGCPPRKVFEARLASKNANGRPR